MRRLFLSIISLALLSSCNPAPTANQDGPPSKASLNSSIDTTKPSLVDIHTEPIPLDTPTMSFVKDTLVPFFARERSSTIRSDGNYPLELLSYLAPNSRLPFSQLEEQLLANNQGTLRDYIKQLEPFSIRFSRDVSSIYRVSSEEYLKSPAATRSLIIRLLSFDKRRGILLTSEQIGPRMYFSQINRNNLRYYTISPSGVFADKTFPQLCAELGEAIENQTIERLLLSFALITKGGFNAVSFNALSPNDQLLLTDLIGISMSEEFRRVSEAKRFEFRKPNRILDPFDLFKTALIMLATPSSATLVCHRFASNFIASRAERVSLQQRLTKDLYQSNSKLLQMLVALDMADDSDMFQKLSEYLRTPAAFSAPSREGLAQLMNALIELGAKEQNGRL